MKPKPRKLTAKDICRREMRNGRGQRCALGWCEKVHKPLMNCYEAENTPLACEIRKMVGRQVDTWNDDTSIPKREIARVINLAAKNLGLEIPQ